ncbi:MAG: S8 family serine peptidase [Thermoleophilia bacterium]|nr:S8 family serine peptidase [Thermoleophilia bacterium]
MSLLKRGLVLSAVLTAALTAAPAHARGSDLVEVVVRLDAPPLARAVAESRALSERARSARLDLRAPLSASYLRAVSASQRALTERVRRAIPSARVRWRYQLVFNGLALLVPRDRVDDLRRVPGVAEVLGGVRYRARHARSYQVIGAPPLWGSSSSNVGRGIKIAIIDDGVDQTHPFFSPTGFSVPPGFPKGNRAFTTPKVIVARAFPPPRPRYANASRPFDPAYSFHGTHVAGIAAGDREITTPGGRVLSGIAPGAFIGNYKALTVPAESYNGLDGNSPEIAAAIETAVRDGMDVINLSLGEPEVEPARDLVVRALNAAADAGVVPAVSAGNDFQVFGRGSIISPGSAAKAITAAASSNRAQIAGFSSSGPTPLSLALKPDVTAPGVEILSSVPRKDGLWQSYNGTSMAAPHVAGAAALLRERHPRWTVAQIKSALVLTGDPVRAGDGQGEAPSTRQGGGLVNLERADDPLLFAAPTAVSFGLVARGRAERRTVRLTDAGGGAGGWSVAVAPQSAGGAAVRVPATVAVPGELEVSVAAADDAEERDATGFIRLTRGAERRRIPYWFRVSAPALARHRHPLLRRPGTYAGSTRGHRALVDTYRYPEVRGDRRVRAVLAGPEAVFRVKLSQPAANFGVRVLSRADGVRVEPRIVLGGNEDRLAGYTALPLNFNPYFRSWLSPVPAAGVVLPKRGLYDIVFDSPTAQTAGRFRFRLWISDTTAPRIRLLSRSVRAGGALRLVVTDGGSGVWPGSLRALVDGRRAPVRYASGAGRASVDVGDLSTGRHTLVFRASDYQETRNHENVYRILPNTRTLRTTFRVR